MKVRVLAFATASDHLGRAPLEVELPDGARLSDLRRLLEAEKPGLAALWPRLAVAVGGQLVQGDPPLSAGIEVALLPPVSGGRPESAVGAAAARPILCHGPLDAAALSREVESPERGALLLFLGAVRNSHAGRSVVALTYSSYEPMAAERIERICRELEAGAAGLKVAIQHRLGQVPAGEASVVIAVASPHRQAAYDASRLALERLKKEVPIWKLEHYGDGSESWREEEALLA